MAVSGWKLEPLFNFEAKFDEAWIDWCLDVFSTTFIMSAIYVVLVFWGQKWMENRPAYKLRVPLIVWNLFIGIFSIIATYRTLPVMVNALYYDGFYVSLCETRYFTKDYIGIWGLFFVLSKVPELVDTLFIILRKQKLIFLHWYHHASTLIFAWRMYSTRSSVALWFCVMNYCVHSLMYSYYTIRAAGFRLPRPIAMTITTLQLAQMFVGMFAVVYAVYQQMNGNTCATETPELILGVSIYTSYMLLFAHFFYNAYIRPKRAPKSPDLSAETSGARVKENGVSEHSSNVVSNGLRRREATSAS